uniref:Expressed protein n=1 Tax=Oryza sativa subsp. japonica TaxID=39947 RepID=Q2R0Z8_ORYSJ|nr:expressed protein [Oryza sativa Japonica Group]
MNTTSFLLQILLLLAMVILMAMAMEPAAPETMARRSPGNVNANHDPSKQSGSAVHPLNTPCNYPGQAGCPH